MNDVRVETDASIRHSKTSLGYVIHVNKGGEYEKVCVDSEVVEKEFPSHQAEEIAVIRGLSEALNYYSGGTVAIMTDSKSIVDRIMNDNKFSSHRNIHKSFSFVTSKFDNVMVKWIPSEENMDAHNACRDNMREDTDAGKDADYSDAILPKFIL